MAHENSRPHTPSSSHKGSITDWDNAFFLKTDPLGNVITPSSTSSCCPTPQSSPHPAPAGATMYMPPFKGFSNVDQCHHHHGHSEPRTTTCNDSKCEAHQHSCCGCCAGASSQVFTAAGAQLSVSEQTMVLEVPRWLVIHGLMFMASFTAGYWNATYSPIHALATMASNVYCALCRIDDTSKIILLVCGFLYSFFRLLSSEFRSEYPETRQVRMKNEREEKYKRMKELAELERKWKIEDIERNRKWKREDEAKAEDTKTRKYAY
ncbi:hypothetical protein DFH27DRAFT_524055 [Peziza echinospora]|nr:hypothetical protein DFH27DRAFT_524055 [Peziza echinospora]